LTATRSDDFSCITNASNLLSTDDNFCVDSLSYLLFKRFEKARRKRRIQVDEDNLKRGLDYSSMASTPQVSGILLNSKDSPSSRFGDDSMALSSDDDDKVDENYKAKYDELMKKTYELADEKFRIMSEQMRMKAYDEDRDENTRKMLAEKELRLVSKYQGNTITCREIVLAILANALDGIKTTSLSVKKSVTNVDLQVR
jgi:hypothetical protein